MSMKWRWSKSSRVLGSAGAILLVACAAHAAPLDEQTCGQLKDEETQLVKGGVKADLDRGADWGKANLGPDRLKQVERYITVEEQLLFRCPRPQAAREASELGPKLKRPLAKNSSAEEDGEAPEASAQKPKSAQVKAAAAKDSKPSPAPKTPKAKSNDAYVPAKKLLPDNTEAQ